MEILQNVTRKEVSLKEMKDLAKETKKIATLRGYFICLTGVSDWNDAQSRYPNHATVQNLKRFIDYDLTSVPHQLNPFWERIVAFGGADSDDIISHVFVHTFESTRCSAVVLQSDVALLSSNVIVDKYPQFSGADLFIVTLKVCTVHEILIGIIRNFMVYYTLIG